MPKVIFKKPWVFYENGCWPVELGPGEADVSEECAEYAGHCGVIEEKKKARK